MKIKEQASIKLVINSILMWIHDRNPGPVQGEWYLDETDTPLILELAFPLIELSAEESAFIPEGICESAMNGNTPETLRHLQIAQSKMTDIGGRLELWKIPKSGINLQLAFPGSATNLEEVADTIESIQNVIDQEVRKDPPM